MSRLSVVVVTSGRLGIDVLERLAALDEVGTLTVVTTSVAGRRRSPLEKARIILRHDGVRGLWRAVTDRWLGRATPGRLAEQILARCPRAGHLHHADLHAPEALAALRALGADLGVVIGAYKLRPSVFTIPRLGCLNLHLGRAPEFRGSSPGFYEMLEGVPEVGVTVHRVTEALDGGAILAQECFALDLAPPDDPIDYLQRFQRETLLPNGARMMASVVAALARGPVAERVQDPRRGRTRPRATMRLKRELRRRVRARRQAASPAGGQDGRAVDISSGRALS